jgi:predicted nucleic acid-binding protein
VGSLIDTSVLAAGHEVAGLDEAWAVSVVTVGELEAGVLIAGE